jgi:hypothetical protein
MALNPHQLPLLRSPPQAVPMFAEIKVAVIKVAEMKVAEIKVAEIKFLFIRLFSY